VAIKWKKKEEDSINEHFPYGLRSATSTNLQVPRPKSEYNWLTILPLFWVCALKLEHT
jgi:hypothetical protein